jgi:hypothetical protein
MGRLVRFSSSLESVRETAMVASMASRSCRAASGIEPEYWMPAQNELYVNA